MIGIDFAGFQNMVDALGGMTVNVCGPIIDGELGTVIAEGGVQTIQGDTALSLVRARKVRGRHGFRPGQDPPAADRAVRHPAAGHQRRNPAEPGEARRLPAGLCQNTFTDNVTIDDLVTLAQSFGTLDPSRVTFFTLPTVPSVTTPTRWTSTRTKAPAVFSALLNDQPLPGEPAATATAQHSDTCADQHTSRRRHPPAETVDPGTIDLAVVNVTGRSGVATETMGQLNDIGFDVSEDDLLAPEGRSRTPSRWNTTPANVAQALTVAAAVPDATLVPDRRARHAGPAAAGQQSFDGTVQSVQVGTAVDRHAGRAAATGALPSGSPVPSLTSGELTVRQRRRRRSAPDAAAPQSAVANTAERPDDSAPPVHRPFTAAVNRPAAGTIVEACDRLTNAAR